MKLTFIGTGSAFTVGDGNFQSNMVLEGDGDSHHKFLIDCGTDARLALYEQELSYQDICAVYVSHLHADHIGGLEWLAFTTKFDSACSKPSLYIVPDLIEELWKTLSTGLYSLKEQKIDLSTYFNVHLIQNSSFNWDGVSFYVFPTLHVMLNDTKMPSYGLYFETNGKNILITTDTQFALDQLTALYEQADLIFHDCETSSTKSGVHAHYTQLCTLNPAIKNKMWLYHYQPGSLPDAKKDGFRGFVKKGQTFNFQRNDTLI
jgi:ribonuclease BN (tRNA processing enzyme)